MKDFSVLGYSTCPGTSNFFVRFNTMFKLDPSQINEIQLYLWMSQKGFVNSQTI